MQAIYYFGLSSFSLIIFYLFYRILFRKERNFKQLRIYLLASIVFSLILPLNTTEISLSIFSPTTEEVPINLPKNQDFENNQEINIPTEQENISQTISVKSDKNNSDWFLILNYFYLSITGIMLLRFISQIVYLTYLYKISEKEESGEFFIIYNSKIKANFSFFNIIFINQEPSDKNIDKIITHEKIHASQYHSFDILLIELLSAVMWFNPAVWMMRNSIQLVHEYLADEGALGTGIDRLKYQTLLLNQVCEERLISLSSSFNHSLIKKRIIMMTNSKINQRTNLRILFLIPIIALLFVGISAVNAQNKNNKVVAVEPVKMNVMYIGVDNPIKIAASGYDSKDLTVSVDNGSVTGADGEYKVRVKRPGTTVVSVSHKGEIIQRTEFRIKRVPDPIPALLIPDGGMKTSGDITKTELLSAGGVKSLIANFDFDLKFQTIEFVLATNSGGYAIDEKSHSSKFTQQQIKLIKELKVGQKLYIENIKARGPDGSVRLMGTMLFRITK